MSSYYADLDYIVSKCSYLPALSVGQSSLLWVCTALWMHRIFLADHIFSWNEQIRPLSKQRSLIQTLNAPHAKCYLLIILSKISKRLQWICRSQNPHTVICFTNKRFRMRSISFLRDFNFHLPSPKWRLLFTLNHVLNVVDTEILQWAYCFAEFHWQLAWYKCSTPEFSTTQSWNPQDKDEKEENST